MGIRRSAPHRQGRDEPADVDMLGVGLDWQIIEATSAEVRSKSKDKYIQRAQETGGNGQERRDSRTGARARATRRRTLTTRRLPKSVVSTQFLSTCQMNEGCSARSSSSRARCRRSSVVRTSRNVRGCRFGLCCVELERKSGSARPALS